jgi:6-phosphogluconolactonase
MLPDGVEILIFRTPMEVAEAGARMLIELSGNRGGRQLKPRIALAGGSTPAAMYQVLRRCTGAEAHALRRVRYFFGDERNVPNTHPDSNVKLAMDGFLRDLGVPSEQIYPLNGGAALLTSEAWRMTLLLERTLPKKPGTEIPQFDLIYLGMGPDGHTASLFPGTEALDSDDHGYVANDVPQLNTRRLTLTFPVLNAAKHLALMVTGENKADVLQEIFTRGIGQKVYPVESLKPAKLTWMLDDAAASRLPRNLLRSARPA